MERRIQPEALERVRNTELTGAVIASGLESLMEQMIALKFPEGHPLSLHMDYRKEGDIVTEGSYYPIITIALVPAKVN